MPTSDEIDFVVDTSVAVPLVVADHTHHDSVFDALAGNRLGLVGHAAFETFSVLTRMPAPARLTASAAARVLKSNFHRNVYLSPQAAADLFANLAANNLSGGRVYDALVGATASEHGIVLATRDRRALSTYQALSVHYELIGGG